MSRTLLDVFRDDPGPPSERAAFDHWIGDISMANSPMWKVYNAEREYRAACKDPEEAAVLVAFFGVGATIRVDHAWIVWTEGAEDQLASESYDHVADVAIRRVNERRAALSSAREQRAAELASEHAARRT